MKIGQTIKCLNSVGSGFLYRDYFYEVIDVNQHGNIRVQCQGSAEKSTHYYKPSRFILVKEKVESKAVTLSKTYRTRHGCKVKIYTVDGDDEAYPVVGVINEGGGWTNAQWTKNGRYFEDATENQWDLFEVPYKTEFIASQKNIKVEIFTDAFIFLSQGSDVVSVNGQVLKEIITAYKKMHGEKSLD